MVEPQTDDLLPSQEKKQGLTPKITEIEKLIPSEVRKEEKMVVFSVNKWNSLNKAEKEEIMTRFFDQKLAKILSLYGDHRTHPAQRVTMQINGQEYVLVKTPYGSNIEPPADEIVEAIGRDRSASSSTGENPTKKDMEIMQVKLNVLRKALEEEGYEGLSKEFRKMKKEITARLRKIYGIPENVKGLFSLSGTEGVLWALLAGVNQYINNQETGTGSILAASGLYSSPLPWHGEGKRDEKAKIEGFEDVKPAMQLPVRDKEGKPIPPEKLLAANKEIVRDSPDQIFGIEAVINGKTGEGGLLEKDVYDKTIEFIQENKNTLLVVDAAQTRIKPEMVRNILADERLEGRVLLFLTGSKWPGKYIFSCQTFAGHGAIEMMEDFIEKKGGIPKGLRDFIGRSDLEDALGKEKAASFLTTAEGKTDERLPDLLNIPAILKWFPALEVMEEFYGYKTDFRDKLVSKTCERIREQIEGEEGQNELRITEGVNTRIHEAYKAGRAFDASAETAVIPYQAWVEKGEEKRPLTKEDLKIIQWLLTFNTAELADKIPNINEETKTKLREILACPCLPGQPVQESPLESPIEELSLEELIFFNRHPEEIPKELRERIKTILAIDKPGREPASLRIAPGMEFFNEILKKVATLDNPALKEIIDKHVAEEITPIIVKSRVLCQHFGVAKQYYEELHGKK
jgi:hypothetical protein